MSVLLDTHTFFWWITGSNMLPEHHRALFDSEGERIYVSAVSGWELAIKVKIGKVARCCCANPGIGKSDC